MSGICGVVRFDGEPLGAHYLEGMLDALDHRGPDGRQVWSHGPVAFGRCLLRTTPEDRSEGPGERFAVDGVAVVGDVRLDNRGELAVALGAGREAEHWTDSAFVRAAYLEWGPACAARLLGDFAVAVWDGRFERLVLLRDHLGVRPLVIANLAGRALAFASEVKAMLTLPWVDGRVDEVRLGDFAVGNLEDRTRTSRLGVRRVPAATVMVVERHRLGATRYWALDPERRLELGSDEEYAEAFRSTFTEAVRARLRAVGPVGSHLSGGLDSSAVTCVADDVLREGDGSTELHTISNVFDVVSESDERPFIRSVTAARGLINHEVAGDRLGPLEALDDVLGFHDEAFTGVSHALMHGLNAATHRLGLRVCLDGFDGDVVVSHGWERFAELAGRGAWQEFAFEADSAVRNADDEITLARIFSAYGLTHLDRLAAGLKPLALLRHSVAASRALPLDRSRLARREARRLAVAVRNRLRPGARRGAAPVGAPEPLLASYAPLVDYPNRAEVFTPRLAPPGSVREAQVRGIGSGALQFTFELFDQYSAHYSFEARHPFFDKRVVELCVAMPSDQKLAHGFTRMVLRRAMAGVLPEDIRWRTDKGNMSPNFRHGLLTADRDRLAHALSVAPAFVGAAWDLDLVSEVAERVSADGRDADTDEVVALWRWVVGILWLERHGHRLGDAVDAVDGGS